VLLVQFNTFDERFLTKKVSKNAIRFPIVAGPLELRSVFKVYVVDGFLVIGHFILFTH
jgi:hypothetical protein